MSEDQVGWCGDLSNPVVTPGSLTAICKLPSGHAGWHRDGLCNWSPKWSPEPREDCGHHTWAGLMALLDEHWPADIFPTLHHDNEARDAGARIVSLLRWVGELKADRQPPRSSR